MRADNSVHLLAASRRRSDEALRRTELALVELLATGERLTVAQVAVAAGVSRSWLYAQLSLRQRIDGTRQRPRSTQTCEVPKDERASAASLRRRLELSDQRNGQLMTENRQLRDDLARAYGALRAASVTGQAPPPDGVPPGGGAGWPRQ